MSVAEVTLGGSALMGVDPRVSRMAGLMAPLPQTVKLGAILPKAKCPALQASNYIDLSAKALKSLPTSTDRRSKAQKSLAHMYLNDQYGDCVFAGKAHNLGVWSANDNDSGGEVQATDAEIRQQYFDYTGGSDSGAVITDVLDIMVKRGFVAGGKTYKIDGYVAVNHTNQNLVMASQYGFGTTSIGIDLPGDWTQNAVWDLTNSRIVGGHDVSPVDFDEKGVYVSSWARIYLITWRAFLSQKWIQEMYAALSPLWYGSDKLAPIKINVAELAADLKKIGQGTVPDFNDPPPPVPPTPPTPGGLYSATLYSKTPITTVLKRV